MTMWDNFDKWNFKIKDDLNQWYTRELIYIENSSEGKVLEALCNGNVILKNFEEDKFEQLWKKGEPNAEGYFTLENYKLPKLMTGISSNGLEIKGNLL